MTISALPSTAERLEARLSTVMAVINQAHAELVEITADALATEA